MATLKVGDEVCIVFDDHATGEDLMRFRVYGILTAKTRHKYTLNSWAYHNEPLSHDRNVEDFTISRRSVVSVRKVVKWEDA